MNRLCRCGGRLVPKPTDSQISIFVCNRCADVRTQRKRQSASVRREDAVRRLRDDALHLRSHPPTTFRWMETPGTWRTRLDVAADLDLVLRDLS